MKSAAPGQIPAATATLSLPTAVLEPYLIPVMMLAEDKKLPFRYSQISLDPVFMAKPPRPVSEKVIDSPGSKAVGGKKGYVKR